MSEWTSFLESAPAPFEDVLVISQSWELPKVLRYNASTERVYEPDGSRYYFYPERMHWMRIPRRPT